MVRSVELAPIVRRMLMQIAWPTWALPASVRGVWKDTVDDASRTSELDLKISTG